MADKSVVAFPKASIALNRAEEKYHVGLKEASFGPIKDTKGFTNIHNLQRKLDQYTAEMKSIRHQLILNKGTEKFIFRYEDGREDELLDALVEQAKNKRTNFDWFDAAVVSFKLTQTLVCQAEGLLHKNTQTKVHVD